MKKNNFLIILTGIFCLFGCNRTTSQPESHRLTVSPVMENIEFSASAKESYLFNVRTDQPEWDATSDQDWCIVTKKADAGNFTVTAKPNDGKTSPPPAKITVTAKNAEAIVINAVQSFRTIYAAGMYLNGQNESVPCYWINGTLTVLPSPAGETNCKVYSMAMIDGNIVAAGSCGTTRQMKACWWNDGKCELLHVPATTDFSTTTGIAISGGKPIISGYYVDESGNGFACYWQNGDLNILEVPSGVVYSSSNSVTVSGGTLYIAGRLFVDGTNIACYWKDGKYIELNLPEGTENSIADGIAVADGIVYTSGFYEKNSVSVPCYWANNRLTELEIPADYDSSSGTYIEVIDGNIYVAGSYEKGNAGICYWKNGKRTDITEPAETDKYGMSLAVYENKVYVSGYYGNDEKSTACYWVDGKPVELEVPNGILTSAAGDIFINEK